MLSRLSACAALLLACGGSPADPGPMPPPPPPPPPGDPNRLHILMIGNSLTYTWDLPGIVADLAAQAGEPRPLVESVTYANFALEDHWLGGGALGKLRSGTPDVLVMQQGPSTLPASGSHLTEWVSVWADEARRVGTKPALYAVWPPSGGNLDAGISNHTAAAVTSTSGLFPVAHAWRLAWRANPSPPLYGPDHFHPGPDGAWLAGLVIAAMLFDRPVSDFPNTMPDRIPPDVEAILRAAASEAIREHGRSVWNPK